MKLCNLFFCLLMGLSFVTASAQEEGEEWRSGEYEEILSTHPKLYVFPDGRYLITNRFQKEIEKVALSVLFFHKDIGDVKREGRLPAAFVRKHLKGIQPFDPVPVMMRPPCCPIYDRDGNLVGSVYPPNGCPSDCKKPISKNGRTYQMDCCLPQNMTWNLMTTLQVQILP